MDLLLLLRRDLALEPDEAALRRQALAHLAGVEIRQHRGEQFDRLVDVDDLARLGEQRRRLDVGREDLAVAVEDVGTRGRDRILRDAAAATVAFADGRKHHQAQRDDRKDAGECDDRKSEPRLRLDVAVHVGAVEKRTQHALPSTFDVFSDRASWLTAAPGQTPVVSGTGASMAPIGSPGRPG